MNKFKEKTLDAYTGVKQLVLENDAIRLVIIPEFGGKITDLISRKTGKQYLLKDDGIFNPDLKPEYGSPFVPPYSSGFDECFPTVAKALIPLNGKLIEIPDHGELWSQEWSYEEQDGELILTAMGVILPYMFIKRVKLSGNQIKLSYQVQNEGSYPIDYIWSSHPLLLVNPGDEVLTLPELDKVVLEWSSDSSIGQPGDTLPWPAFRERTHVKQYRGWCVNEVPNRSERYAVKLFSEKLKEGLAGFHAYGIDETLLFRFNAAEVPYLGIWLCNGGWPDDALLPEYTVAIEPTSGRYDNLSKAISINSAQKIMPGDSADWDLMLEIIPGIPDSQSLLNHQSRL